MIDAHYFRLYRYICFNEKDNVIIGGVPVRIIRRRDESTNN